MNCQLCYHLVQNTCAKHFFPYGTNQEQTEEPHTAVYTWSLPSVLHQIIDTVKCCDCVLSEGIQEMLKKIK